MKTAQAPTQKTGVEATLEDRLKKYGVFAGHAGITQEIKGVMYDTDKWSMLEADQRESLEMIAHKIGRILNGDPNLVDSWHDIAGYATLVENRLKNGTPK